MKTDQCKASPASHNKLRSALLTLLLFSIIIAAWEVCAKLIPELRLILPAPSQVAWQMMFKPQRLFFHATETLKVMCGGFLLAAAVAFPLAWSMLTWNTLRTMLQPLFILSQCVPMFTLAPLMVVWFGWTFTAIVIPTALMIFFPLTMSIYRGLCSTPQLFLDYFLLNQATPLQIFYKLQLPWAVPSIFSGLRVSAGLAGVGAVAGEWAGAQNGLGLLMLESRRASELETVFSALACLTILTLLIYGTIVFLEKQIIGAKFMRKAKTICLALTAFTLIGCQSNPPTNETRLMLDWLPNPNHVPLYVGIEKEFFSKRGIFLAIRKITDPADPLIYLSAGETDLAISYMPSVIIANSHGANVNIVGILIPEPLNAFIYRKGEDIEAPIDLDEKVFGYCIDSTGRNCMNHLLAEKQVHPSQLKNVVFDSITALGTKQVDVVYGSFWNIECEQMRAKGIDANYFKLSDFGMPNYAELVVLARQDSLQSRPDFVQNFQAALQECIDYCKKNPDEAFEVYIAANPDKSESTYKWEKESWHKTYPLLSATQDMNEEGMREFEVWLNNVQKKM